MQLPSHAARASRAATAKNKTCTWLTGIKVPYHTIQQHRQQQQCRPPKAAAEAAAAVSAPFNALSTWLAQNGGSVGSITAGDCQMGDVTVRGLVALEDLPPSTPILSVPVSR
jgi:hypothetical protein